MRTSLRTRLTLSTLAVVAGALTLAGFGAIVLQERSTVMEEESHLLSQARTVATSLDAIRSANALGPVLRIAGITGVTIVPYDSSGNLLIGQQVGSTIVNLPPGLDAADFPAAKVLAGGSFSGRVGQSVYAAVATESTDLFRTCPSGYRFSAPLDLCIRNGVSLSELRQGRHASASAPSFAAATTPPGNACATIQCAGTLVVLTSPATTRHGIIGYFLIASATTLALAAAVAMTISTRIVSSLRRAVATTERIAKGDLDARVASSRHDYPEVASLARSLDTMRTELRDARDLQRSFLLSVSHDLRTPLTSIRGYAEAISDGAVDDPQRAASVIAAESRRLERLVSDLLDLARLSAHSFSLELGRVDAAEVLATTADGFQPALATEGLALVNTLVPGASLEVVADPDRLAQVFSNLIENSFKYARSQVVLRAWPSEGWVVISVEDDGPGIPADDLPHVFERLYSGNQVPARRAGTGLGLAIVAELVHAMGGSIRAESPLSSDGGTRMLVFLRQATDVDPAHITSGRKETSSRARIT